MLVRQMADLQQWMQSIPLFETKATWGDYFWSWANRFFSLQPYNPTLSLSRGKAG